MTWLYILLVYLVGVIVTVFIIAWIDAYTNELNNPNGLYIAYFSWIAIIVIITVVTVYFIYWLIKISIGDCMLLLLYKRFSKLFDNVLNRKPSGF